MPTPPRHAGVEASSQQKPSICGLLLQHPVMVQAVGLLELQETLAQTCQPCLGAASSAMALRSQYPFEQSPAATFLTTTACTLSSRKPSGSERTSHALYAQPLSERCAGGGST